MTGIPVNTWAVEVSYTAFLNRAFRADTGPIGTALGTTATTVNPNFAYPTTSVRAAGMELDHVIDIQVFTSLLPNPRFRSLTENALHLVSQVSFSSSD